MPRRCINFTDENYEKVAILAKEKGCSMNAVVNQCVAEFASATEEKDTLQIMKIIQRESERKLNILYAAFNNFLLNFAANQTEYVQPYVSEHAWLRQAALDEESRMQMKAHKKKLAGGDSSSKPPDEKRRNGEPEEV